MVTNEMTDQRRSVLLVGATGLVGAHCLGLLEADALVERIVVLTRRPVQRPLADKTDQRLIDFEQLADHAELFTVDQVFVCLGTTRKSAGTKEAFIRVDHDLVLEVARLAASAGVRDLLLISGLGANSASPLLYPRTKGRVEAAVAELGFPSLTIFRPSALTGDRERPRPGEVVVEKFGSLFGFLFLGPLKRLRPIAASEVARAMVRVSAAPKAGLTILDSSRMGAALEVSS